MNKRDPYYVGIILILLALVWFQWNSAGEEQRNRSEERERFLKSESKMKVELGLLEAQGLAEREARSKKDSVASLEKERDLGALNALKAKERRSRPNPTVLTLTDTVYAEYDSVLAKADLQRKADSLSFENEIRILGQRTMKLDSANDAKFHTVQELYTTISQKENLIDKLKGWVKGLGISSVALTALLILISVL